MAEVVSLGEKMTILEYSHIHTETAWTVPARVPDPVITAAYRNLAIGILNRAVLDIGSANPRTAANALAWLLGDGMEWLDILGLPCDPDHVQLRILEVMDEY